MKRSQRVSVVFGRSSSRRRSAPVRPTLEGLEARLVMSGVNVSTYHNDSTSSGVNAAETTLSPNTVKVGSFGKLYSTAVDASVLAQPLVQTGVTIAAGSNTTAGSAGPHDIVLVATEKDSLYAIDTGAGTVLWKRSFLDPTNPAGDTNNTLNATAIASLTNTDVNTGDIAPNIGITGTPVIDPVTKVAYVVTATKETIGGATHFVQRLHAVNLTDGTDKATPSLVGDTTNGNTNNTPIYASGSGDGSVPDPNNPGKSIVQFNALRENQRTGLSLVNGSVYVEYASHGDNGPYHGWVTRYDVSNLSAGLRLTGVLNTSPNGGEAGVWQGSGKLSFDSSGAFFLETGNGPNSHPAQTYNAQGFPSDGNYYEAVLKVVTDPTSTPTANNPNGWGLKVADFFIPHNAGSLDAADSDFGSGAPLILPDSAGIAGHPHLLVAGGKQGVIYVVDRDSLGKFNATTDAVVSEQNVVNGDWGTPAYFNGKIYFVGGNSGGNTRSLTLNANGTLAIASQSTNKLGGLSGSPSISANGTTGGIVWNLDRSGTNSLHAYDASALTTELWNSNQAANNADTLGYNSKFATPTVANGEVFVGTSTNALVAYGLKSPPKLPPTAPSNLAATSPSSSSVSLTWTDNSTSPNVATGFTVQDSTDGVNFTTVATAPGGSTAITVGGLLAQTLYDFRINAFDGSGSSAFTKAVPITTGTASTQVPAAPTGLGGSAASANSVRLSWTNNATNQTGFALDRATDSAFTQNVVTQTLPASPTSFTDTAAGMTPGNTYYYRIRATNSAGPSTNSNVVPISIPVAPAAPTNPAVTVVTTTEIDLTWTDNAGTSATGYTILRATGTGNFVTYATEPAKNAAPGTSYGYKDTGATPGTSYRYEIEAVNSSGNNGFAAANAETITLAPSSLTSTPGNGQVSLTWTAPAGAVSYTINRGTAPGQESLYQSGVTATTYTDPAATNGTKYYYTVTAVNSNATHAPVLPSASAPSTEVSATPAPGAAAPVINFPSGFASGTAGVLTFNGGAAVVGSNLQLTDGGGYEARSVFTTNPVAIGKFTTTFNFQLSAGANTADGFAFVVQGVGNTALGGLGGSLGYQNITKSLAVKFDLYSNSGEGVNSTGVYTNGAAPMNVGSIDLTGTVNLHSGDPMTAKISYDGANLSESITDTVTKANFSHTYTGLNIASLVGAGQAYVGFTAGTGGLTATQNIQSWTYSTTAPAIATHALSVPPTAPAANSAAWAGNSSSTGIADQGATAGTARHPASGSKVNSRSANVPRVLYGYSFALNKTKAVKSITPPNQSGVKIIPVADLN